MGDIVPQHARLAPTSQVGQDKVREFDAFLKKLPQYEFVTEHMIHGRMYTRSVQLPKDVAVAAVFIQVPTVLIVVGSVDVYNDGELLHVEGYNVLPGSAKRKIAFVTYSRMGMSMIFHTDAETVEEAQKQFTPEFELLPPLTELHRHRTLITGE